MRAPSQQILSVERVFGTHGWHCERLDGRDVIRAQFSAHHGKILLHAQSYTPINALSIVGESPLPLTRTHQPYVLELLMRANMQLNLGAFEYDLDRKQLAFRITNIFEREQYDADIVTSMVHCAIAEMDRMLPFAAMVQRNPVDTLADLNLTLLLQREDLLPVVPEDND